MAATETFTVRKGDSKNGSQLHVCDTRDAANEYARVYCTSTNNHCSIWVTRVVRSEMLAAKFDPATFRKPEQ